MDRIERIDRGAAALDGWPHGPGAPARATQQALRKADDADAIIVVEGISDQMALETLARRQGRDLGDERVAVLPVGGAQAMGAYLRRFGPQGDRRHLAGLCDADAAELVRRTLWSTGVGRPTAIADMIHFGFHVCVKDLEDELIRAVGIDTVFEILERQGELRSFRTLQKQPEWRGRSTTSQLRRFIAAKSRRSLRYAVLLVEAMDPTAAPDPLEAVLNDI